MGKHNKKPVGKVANSNIIIKRYVLFNIKITAVGQISAVIKQLSMILT